MFSKDEVHKIAVLDLRLLNLDRNECNILVKSGHPHCQIDCCHCSARSDNTDNKSCWSLVPIDHGLSIPDILEVSDSEIAWLGFDQAEEPFS